jgi:hypothetical protein
MYDRPLIEAPAARLLANAVVWLVDDPKTRYGMKVP